MAKRERVVAALGEHGINSWYDEANIQIGQALTVEIFPRIRDCACALFIITPNSIESDWVRREVQFALNAGKPIILISFGRVNIPEDFPGELEDIKRIVVRHKFTRRLKKQLTETILPIYNRKQAPIVTLLNLKGGVGKTMLSANLFGCIHETMDKSILLIDLDPQHNLTQLLLDQQAMAQCLNTSKTVMSIFRGFADMAAEPSRVSIANVLARCRQPLKVTAPLAPRIDLIPGTFEIITYFLGNRNQHFDRESENWINFRKFIEHCKREYDYIAIDVNPGATLMTEVALSVSTHIISPVRPDRFAAYGLGLLDELLQRVDANTTNIKRLAIMNGVQPREDDEIERSLREHGVQNVAVQPSILSATIPYSKKLVARPARPNPTGDKTIDLAYRSGRGSSVIRRRLGSVAVELVEELDRD